MSVQLFRAGPIEFVFPDGRKIVAPPVTRGQIGEVYALGKAEEETAAKAAEVRGRQVAVFLRHAAFMQADGKTHAGPIQEALDLLSAEAEIDIIWSFIAQHHGYSPDSAAALQQAMREIVDVKKKAKSLTSPE